MPRKTLLLGFALTVLLSPAAVFAQNTTLQGVVRGETQTPVSGAFVVIPSLDMSTVTNEYGSSSRQSVSPGSRLRFRPHRSGTPTRR
jgi:hypothetical protein